MFLKILTILIAVPIILNSIYVLGEVSNNEVNSDAGTVDNTHDADQKQVDGELQEPMNVEDTVIKDGGDPVNAEDTVQPSPETILSSKTEVVSENDKTEELPAQQVQESDRQVSEKNEEISVISSVTNDNVEPSRLDLPLAESSDVVSLDSSSTQIDAHNKSEDSINTKETPVLSNVPTSSIEDSAVTSQSESVDQMTVSGGAPSPTPVSAPPETSTEAITAVNQDETDTDKQEEDFPSFTEWTQKVLAEEEKTKQETKSSGQPIPSSVVQKKLRNNYASNSCGAKILGANPEAENVQSVLTANKDEYMINPCSSKKWFLVELCEPVQVKMVEMASLELFSSQPKSFRISLSDRYPAKEWQPLGIYELQQDRSVQSFTVLNDQFVKYVKVELIEHYGNEHFCPLTLFRLYGLPITDDDDNDESNNPTDSEIDSTVTDEEQSKEGSVKNLVTSVKDSVVKLVKKVLNVNDINDKDNSTEQTELRVNISTDGTILPCVPSASHHQNVNRVDSPNVLFPTPTVKQTTVDTSSDVVDLPIVTKLDDDEQPPSEEIINAAPDMKLCLNTSQTSPKTLCSYIQTMLGSHHRDVCRKGDFILITATSTASQALESTEILTSSKNSFTETSNVLNSLKSEVSVGPPSQSSETVDQIETQNTEPIKVLPTATQELLTTSMSEGIPAPDRETEQATKDRVVQDTVESRPETENTETFDTNTQILLEPSTSDISKNIIDQSEVTTQGLEVEVTATTSESLVEQTKMESDIPSIPNPESSQPHQDIVLPTISVSKTESLTSSDEVKPSQKVTPGIEIPVVDKVPPKSGGRRPRDLDLVKVPLGSFAKRESAIMRLTNRIKALEVNVSLSSRFLEELSKKFKRQNEDMMKLMNKTIAKLNNTTKESEMRDQQQQRQLQILEARMDNLTSLVDSLSHNMETLANKLSDRQLVWSSIEFVMLMIVCVVCLMRGRPIHISPELKYLLETMPKQPNPATKQRRNSDVGSIGHALPSTPIRKNTSLSTLVCDKNSPPVLPLLDTAHHLAKEGHRKKKKKKKHIQSNSSTFIGDKSNDDQSPVQISQEAGILFGTDAGSTLSGVGIQEVDPGPQSHSSSSSTVSLPAACHRRTFSDDIRNQMAEKSEPKKLTQKSAQIGHANKSKKQNRFSISGPVSDIKIETLKSLHCKTTKQNDDNVPMTTSTTILTESRNKSRVSWLF